MIELIEDVEGGGIELEHGEDESNHDDSFLTTGEM